jgi:hypothetical protein
MCLLTQTIMPLIRFTHLFNFLGVFVMSLRLVLFVGTEFCSRSSSRLAH